MCYCELRNIVRLTLWISCHSQRSCRQNVCINHVLSQIDDEARQDVKILLLIKENHILSTIVENFSIKVNSITE